VVWQTIETAWVSASLGGSYWSQQRQLANSTRRGPAAFYNPQSLVMQRFLEEGCGGSA